MNRTILLRSKPLRRKSERQKTVDKCLSLIRKKLIEERGASCELCGKHQDELPMPLSLFHILPRSTHPRLILNTFNILLACWIKEKYYYMKAPACHNIWEHQKFLKDGSLNPKWVAIENKIKELRGNDYNLKLLAIEFCAPRLNETYLKTYLEALKNYNSEV